MAKETVYRRYALRSTDEPDLSFIGDAESSFYGIGDRRDNVITGADANDTLNGGAGIDTLIGSDGNDTYIVDEFDKVVEFDSGGLDTIWSYMRTGSYSLPDQVENLVQKVTVRSGGTLYGNALNNQITGASSNDTIDGNGGSDTLIGGLGVDTFVVTQGLATVNDLGYGGYDNFTVEKGAKLTAIATSNWIGSRSVINEGEVKILSKGKLIDLSLSPQRNGFDIENLGGSAKLIGSAAEDTIMGGKFSDTLQGSGGNDTISGGLGADTFLVDSGRDKITDLGLGGTDVIQLYLGAQVDAVLSTHWVGRGTVNYSDDGNARIFANGKSVNLSSVTTGNGYYIENLSDVGGSISGDAVTIWGSAAEDTIIGGINNDTLYGGRGDDRIIGLGGSDRIDAGPGSDTVVISAGDVSVDSLIGGDGVDTLEVKIAAVPNPPRLSGNVSGFESVALMADTSANPPVATTLTVSPQMLISNSLVSLKGSSDSADTEQFVVTLTNSDIKNSRIDVNLSKVASVVDVTVVVDSTILSASSATVTAVGTSFGDHFKSGSATVKFDGGAGSDTMYGGYGDDSFLGNAGADSLYGGKGDDTLSGGEGVDTLLGGKGYDRLIIQAGDDTVGDFFDGGQNIDVLLVRGAVNLWDSPTTVKGVEEIQLAEGASLMIDFRAFRTRLDVTINGNGYFQINLPTGDAAYTRVGNFTQDNQGQLTNMAGYLVAPGITIPVGAELVTISEFGQITADVNGVTQQLGQLQIVNFVNPAGLESIGGGLYVQSVASGSPTQGTPGQNGLGTLTYKDYSLNNIQRVDGTSGGGHETVTVITDKYNGPAHDFSETINLSYVEVYDAILAIEAYGGADAVTGSSTGANSIDGGSGADTITGGSSDDVLMGGADNDSIVGNDGADTIQGGEGIDTLTGNRGNPTTHRDAAADTFVYTNYTEAPIGTPTWIDAAGQPLALGDPLVVGAIDYGAESIIGFEVAKDYLDLPDGGTDLPVQIKAIPNTALLAVTSGSLDIKPYQQTDITISATHKYQVLNGVLKVWSDANRTVDGSINWALHNWLALVDSIADTAISPAATGGVIVFEYKVDPSNSDTYVFARGGTTSNDLLIRLAGVTGITAFSEQSNGLPTTLAGG